MLYFGLSLHMPEFDADIYILFLLSGLAEIPAAILPLLWLNRYLLDVPRFVSLFYIGSISDTLFSVADMVPKDCVSWIRFKFMLKYISLC